MLQPLFVALTLGAAAPAPSPSFTPSAVGAALPGPSSYVVVPAGPPSERRDAAARSLEASLARSGSAVWGLDAGARTLAEHLDDARAVEWCEAVPAARVAVVRMVERVGEPLRATAAVYRKDGARVAALEAVPAPPPAPDVLDRDFVWIRNVASLDDHGAAMPHEPEMYRGLDARRLSGREFYEGVGRSDLAERYERVQWKRRWAVAGGATLAVAGIASAALFTGTCGGSNGTNHCAVTNDGIWGPIALAGGLAGALIIGAAVMVDPSPVPPAELRALAEAHNAKLRVGAAPVPGGAAVGFAGAF